MAFGVHWAIKVHDRPFIGALFYIVLIVLMNIHQPRPINCSEMLAAGNLRTTGASNGIAQQVTTQEAFDLLFACTQHPDRKVVMRSLDAMEKITLTHPHFLKRHKKEILYLFEGAEHKEAKWHLAQLVPRLPLTRSEIGKAWHRLTHWALDKEESRIVRALSVQALHDLLPRVPQLSDDLLHTAARMYGEKVPSINARIRKLKLL